VSERTSRKIPVTERQFLWVQDDDKGEVILHVGPTMVSPTAADRIVVDDGQGGFREDTSGQPQRMVELSDNQYAVLYNPLLENDGGPNGRFRTGRNETRAQKHGTRSMIPGPCSFYLRPGQRAEVRDAHELASDQYLVVKVYGEVDKAAPFYEMTAKSAAITKATAENVGDAKGSSSQLGDLAAVELKRGQLVVIRGLDTQFYIPPTGVDIVPDTSVDDSGSAISSVAARQILSQLPAEAPKGAALDDALLDLEETPQSPRRNIIPSQIVDQSARNRQRKPAVQSANVAPEPPKPEMNLSEVASIESVRRALEKEARQARLVRRAVVLGEKEYCVIIDADGKREIKVGPARVFPGPYDTFMTKGSRRRVYDAYELLPQRALWLRVISSISRPELEKKLPRGFALESKDGYFPGDELLLTGVSTFFFPFNEIEVLSPETGEAVVGNDHSRVFIEAIGIDQKSGIYVRDLATGEARLVRGKLSYLVDPRKEVQITRNVPTDDWNLWIAANEAHKSAASPVTTPWALSITVPHNMAVLATSAGGQRVIEGPCVTLLEYEERLTPLLLSTGTPKSDEDPLRTCYLRVRGNRVSDEVAIETADFVKINIRVSYSVTFRPEYKERWFNHENYIQVLIEHLRSLVRSRVRMLSLSGFWPSLPALVRDTILGEKTSEGRPGRLFAENGMEVTEVEVLSSEIDDERIAGLMQKVQTESVMLQLGDRQAQESLASAKLRAEVDRQTQELSVSQREREASLQGLIRKLSFEAALIDAKNQESLARERQQLALTREHEAQQAKLAREHDAKEQARTLFQREVEEKTTAARLIAGAELEKDARLAELETLLVQAQSAATVAERRAVQSGLIEAMTALGDKLMLSEVAQNMNLVSLFQGKDVGDILAGVVGGTKLAPLLDAIRKKVSTGENS
jgi:major vault protein